jgi:CBS domain-containing protein
MNVGDIMQTKVQTVAPDVPVLDAVTTMSDLHVSALPVLDMKGSIVGVISTTDVLQAEAEADDSKARAALFERSIVSDLMTARVRTIEATASIADAAQQMLYLEVHRLFVVEDGKLVGVVSQTDIVRAVAEQLRLADVHSSARPVHHDGRRHRRPGKIQPPY